ncbi:MAG: helix-turn-helix domain-containing protein [Lentisphaerales bacterium]|nr:helix-turn-helix domain-containing protein [Lentisphaerales bacterium]
MTRDKLLKLRELLTSLRSGQQTITDLQVIQSPEGKALAANVIAAHAARIIYIESGQLNCEVNNQPVSMVENNILVIGQHCKFDMTSLVGVAHEFILSHPSVWYIYHKDSDFEPIIPIKYVSTDSEKQFIDIWQALTLYSERPAEYSLIKNQSLCTLLFNEMSYYLTLPIEKEKKKDKGEAEFFAILSYMAENIQKDLNRLEICDKFSINYKKMSRLFMHWQRCNFKQTLIQLRLNKARGLLVTSDRSIAEIASATGFNSPDHFIYCFRQIFGMSPFQLNKKTTKQQNQTAKAKMALHEMAEFSFLTEFTPDEIPDLEQDSTRIGAPTVCYFANESGEVRHLYEIYAGSREVFVAKIDNHRRYRFNVTVGTVFKTKNDAGDYCSTFIIADKLCQGVFSL